MSMHIASLVKIPCYLLKLSSGNENMGVSRADISVKIWRNLSISNPKPDLHNINAHTKFGENPLMFTQVIIWKRKMDWWTTVRTDERTDVRRTDGYTDYQRETIIPRHYCVTGYKNQISQVLKGQILVLIFTPCPTLLNRFQLNLLYTTLMQQYNIFAQVPPRSGVKRVKSWYWFLSVTHQNLWTDFIQIFNLALWVKFSAEDILKYFSTFGDNWHEMSNTIFWENKQKYITILSPAESAQRVIKVNKPSSCA